ncbi:MULTISPECIES: hypothetical protein [Pantoea]|nr:MULTISPECIES: hypothetical protein [Pantoea]
MMPALNLPNKLWRPLAEVKNFVEKMSDGVRLPQMSQKVKSFASLSRKDKDILIRYLNERDCINVIQARPLNGGNLTTFFFHQKFGLPTSIPGFDWDGKAPKITMPVEENVLPIPEFDDKAVVDDVDDSVDEPEKNYLNASSVSSIQDIIEPQATKPEKLPIKNSTSGNVKDDSNDLRKRALEMLMAADRQDQSRVSKVLSEDIKPKIDEFIIRLNTANDAVQSTLDTLYDQMGEVDKISMEFKKFCASL